MAITETTQSLQKSNGGTGLSMMLALSLVRGILPLLGLVGH